MYYKSLEELKLTYQEDLFEIKLLFQKIRREVSDQVSSSPETWKSDVLIEISDRSRYFHLHLSTCGS